eukprot:sb/3460929/
MESSDSCPLINDYKQKFLISRLVQTIFGGVRLSNVPKTIVFSQLLLFITPLLLLVIINISVNEDSQFYATIPVCLLVLLLLVFVNFARDFVGRRKQKEVHVKRTVKSMLAEEDSIEIDGVFSHEHFTFLVPQKSHIFKILDPVLYGGILFLGAISLHKSHLPEGTSSSDYYAVFILSSISLCTGLFGLVSNPAPEVAIFNSNSPISHLYRPFYLALLTGIAVGLPAFPTYILLGCLFIIFPLGILPSPECLFHWILELLLSWPGFGSSPHPSALICCLRAVLAYAALSVVYSQESFSVIATLLISFFLMALPIPMSVNDALVLLKSWKLWVHLPVLVIACGLTFVPTEDMSNDGLGYAIIALACLMYLLSLLTPKFILRLFYNPLIEKLPPKRLRYPYPILCWISRPILFSYVLLSESLDKDIPRMCLPFIFTRIWLDPRTSCYAGLITVIVGMTVGDESFSDFTSIPFLMAMSGFGLVVLEEFCDRMEFYLRLHGDFLFLKKQRRSSWMIITLVNVLCFPLTISFLLLSSLIRCEILPIFTLPILLPSFPRPHNFWPWHRSGHTSSSPDGAYYRNFGPKLAAALTPLLEGRGYSTKPLLCRVENLMVLVQPLTNGLAASGFVLRGLELKETSCHTEEANVVKEIFEGARSATEKKGSSMNSKPFHILQPVAQINVETYSDARNVLTGVLDSPACLAKIGDYFGKVLSYTLVEEGITGKIEYEESTTLKTGGGRGGFDFSAISRTSPAVVAPPPRVSSTQGPSSTANVGDLIDDFSFASSEESWDGTVTIVGNPVAVSTTAVAPSDHSSEKSQVYIQPSSGDNVPVYKIPLSVGEVEKLSKNGFSEEFYSRCGGSKEMKEWVRGITVCARGAVNHTSAHQALKSFQGDLEWSKCSEWVKEHPEIRNIIVTSFRHAVKLAVDEVVYGEAESTEEVIENMRELRRDWFIGREEDTGWSESVLAGKKYLFSLYLNDESVYSSRTLTLQLLPVDPHTNGLAASGFLLRGLELKETSCHTEEANVVKEIFEGARSATEKKGSSMNSKPFHILQPVGQINVETYSDARNVLTGVLDSPACLAKIGDYFGKVLSYTLVEEGITGKIEYEESTTLKTGGGRGGFDFSAISRTSPAVVAPPPRVSSTQGPSSTANVGDLIDDFSFASSEESWDGTVTIVGNPVAVSTTAVAPSDHSSEKSQVYIQPSSGDNVPVYKIPLSVGEVEKLSKNGFSEEFYSRCGGSKEMKEWVRGITVCARGAVNHTSAHQALKSFQGDLEWSKCSEWVKEHPEIRNIIVTSFRHAVKLAVDEVVYGEAESTEEVIKNMRELRRDWFIGREEDTGWSESVLAGKKYLFSLYLNDESVYSSRTLTLQLLPVDVGELNRTAVRALWTSLSFELYYLTNDDEERYSIQAHPNILRNLLVQSADVPLGYPIYQSPVIMVPHL